MKQLLFNSKLQAACPLPFDEAKLWKGQKGPELKQQIQKQFRNIRSFFFFRPHPFHLILWWNVMQVVTLFFYVMQCTDGLCRMWEMSSLGEASGSWSWYCIEDPLFWWWLSRTLGSGCKDFWIINFNIFASSFLFWEILSSLVQMWHDKFLTANL